MSLSFGRAIGGAGLSQFAFARRCRPPRRRKPPLMYAHAALDLLEYQGKQLFAGHGVPVPEGKVADTVEAAVEAAEEIGYPCVIKAQVQIGGRGKGGGVKGGEGRAEGEGHAKAVLGQDIPRPRGGGPLPPPPG